jgi:hypothetical protein
MLPSETTIPATVTVLSKRVRRPHQQANERIITVSLGDWEWDLYVPEDEFACAMAGLVVEMRQREKEVLEL